MEKECLPDEAGEKRKRERQPLAWDLGRREEKFCEDGRGFEAHRYHRYIGTHERGAPRISNGVSHATPSKLQICEQVILYIEAFVY